LTYLGTSKVEPFTALVHSLSTLNVVWLIVGAWS